MTGQVAAGCRTYVSVNKALGVYIFRFSNPMDSDDSPSKMFRLYQQLHGTYASVVSRPTNIYAKCKQSPLALSSGLPRSYDQLELRARDVKIILYYIIPTLLSPPLSSSNVVTLQTPFLSFFTSKQLSNPVQI